MIRIILILTTFLFISQANAEMINKLIIEGNKRVSDETIKVYGDIDINRDISESSLNKIINNLYSTNFFKDVSAKDKLQHIIHKS
jgi:outer membrane protein insertion porin family